MFSSTQKGDSKTTSFLQAVNDAACCLQKAILSEANVYKVFREQVENMNLRGGFCLLDESKTILIFKSVGYGRKGVVVSVISNLRKITGLTEEGFSFPINKVKAYKHAITTREVVFVPDSSEIIRQILPSIAVPFAGPLIKVLNTEPTIIAPLIVKDAVIGTCNFGGDLSEADCPAIMAFANHLAVALENARLFESTQEAYGLLEESEFKHRNLVMNIPGMVYRAGADWSAEIVNGCFELSGYTGREINLVKNKWLGIVHEDDREKVRREGAMLAVEPCSKRHTYRIIHKSGEVRWVEDRARSIFSAEGDFKGIEGIVFDVTEQKRSEEKLKDSLKEKDLLLQEVYHRVKNNLQIITSLLHLKSRKVPGTPEQNVLNECQGFVRSMGLVHEKLYGSVNVGKINFKDYIDSIIKEVMSTRFKFRSDTTDIRLDLDEIMLSVDQAIPCGLLLNELLSNTMTHAFGRDEVGGVQVSLHQKGRRVTLSVKDDGAGLPSGFDLDKSKSFGLKLIRRLVEDQLHGRFEMKSGNGTESRVEFDLEKA